MNKSHSFTDICFPGSPNTAGQICLEEEVSIPLNYMHQDKMNGSLNF